MRRFLCLLAAASLPILSLAQGLPAPKSGLTIERLSSFPIVNGRSPSGPAMAPDGRRIAFSWNQTGERRLDLWVMDYPSGNKRRILEADKLPRPPRQDDERTELQKQEELEYDGGIGGVQWAPDSQEIMAGPYRGRVWLMKPDGSNLRPLIDTSEQISSPTYSPDGKWIAFLRGDDLYRLDRATGQVRQLTYLSKSGTALDGFLWSPDSKRIGVTWSNTSRLGRHVMMDFTKDRAEVVPIQRLWNGDRGWDVQVGIVNAEGGLIRFLPGVPRYMWISTWDWSPDSKSLALGWFSEDFQEYTITVADGETSKAMTAYREKAPSNYVPDFRSLFWTRDGRIAFTTDILDGKWASRSLMSMDRFGQNRKPIYAEKHDIAAAGRPKNSDRIILVTQARSSLTTEITILETDGRRTVHTPVEDGASTPNQFDDASLPLFSEDGRSLATLASTRVLNNELCALEPRQARLTESQLPDFKKIQWAKFEKVSFPGPDGATIHGVLITPPNLDRTKKHPAFISSMYANSGKLAWAGYMENYAAMELGMVVLQVDFRASWGQGGEFNSGYYKKMGIVDSDEAVKAKEFLTGLGYVNPNRVGVWGWSYGGYLTCMIMLTRPGVFDTGVAVASVTDWKTYNEWYTRRRLGLPSEDDEIYKKTSPVHHAIGLTGNLLLVHGMLDDNVLYQDTVRLQENLIREGKVFDTFAYPRGDHGMGRTHERPHVNALILRYLWQKLSRP